MSLSLLGALSFSLSPSGTLALALGGADALGARVLFFSLYCVSLRSLSLAFFFIFFLARFFGKATWHQAASRERLGRQNRQWLGCTRRDGRSGWGAAELKGVVGVRQNEKQVGVQSEKAEVVGVRQNEKQVGVRQN